MPARRAPARTTYVALLRGINVGGNRRIKMADLREMVEAAGGEDVSTYIQSGNVILRSSEKAAAVGASIEAEITKATGFEVPVIVRSRDELRKVVAGNPWDGQDIEGTHLVVIFLPKKPAAGALKSIDADAFAPEEVVLDGREVYLHLPSGQADSKLVIAVGKDKAIPPGTARNWKSTTKLLELADETAALP